MSLDSFCYEVSLPCNFFNRVAVTKEIVSLQGCVRQQWLLFNSLAVVIQRQFNSLLLAHHAVTEFRDRNRRVLAFADTQTSRGAQRLDVNHDVVLSHLLQQTVG